MKQKIYTEEEFNTIKFKLKIIKEQIIDYFIPRIKELRINNDIEGLIFLNEYLPCGFWNTFFN